MKESKFSKRAVSVFLLAALMSGIGIFREALTSTTAENSVASSPSRGVAQVSARSKSPQTKQMDETSEEKRIVQMEIDFTKILRLSTAPPSLETKEEMDKAFESLVQMGPESAVLALEIIKELPASDQSRRSFLFHAAAEILKETRQWDDQQVYQESLHNFHQAVREELDLPDLFPFQTEEPMSREEIKTALHVDDSLFEQNGQVFITTSLSKTAAALTLSELKSNETQNFFLELQQSGKIPQAMSQRSDFQ